MAEQGIFGPPPELIAQALDEKGRAESYQMAQLPAGRGAVAGMAEAGRQFGKAIQGAAGYEDPQIARARLMQEAQMEVEQSNVNLMEDSKGYYKAAYEALSKRGLTQEAMQVRNIMLQEEATMAETAYKTRNTSKGYGMSGNILYSRDTGDYNAVDGYQGKGSGPKVITMSPPGSTVKGTGQEKTLEVGTPEYEKAIAEGWIDTSKIPGPAREGQSIEVKATFEQQKDRGDLAKGEMEDIRSKGRNADLLRRQTSMLRDQLSTTNFDPGTLSNFRETVAGAAQYFGVSDETLTDFRNNPNDAAVLGSITNNMVGVMANAMQSGNNQLSATELKLFKESAPNMGQTAQGMYVLNEMIDKYAAYEQKLRDYATEQYAQLPEDGNDANILVAIDKWKRENPFYIDKATQDRLRRHAKIIEQGKKASNFLEVPKDKTVVGAMYRLNGLLYYYKGVNPKTNKVILEPAN